MPADGPIFFDLDGTAGGDDCRPVSRRTELAALALAGLGSPCRVASIVSLTIFVVAVGSRRPEISFEGPETAAGSIPHPRGPALAEGPFLRVRPASHAACVCTKADGAG